MEQPVTVPDPTIEPTITVERAGALLGLGRNSAYDAVRRGDIPSIKIGHRYVVPTARIRSMLGLDMPVAQ